MNIIGKKLQKNSRVKKTCQTLYNPGIVLNLQLNKLKYFTLPRFFCSFVVQKIFGMFSIGLFSTYLPYVMIAMFYGAYVGLHSIIKAELQGDPGEFKIAAKQIAKEDTGSPETEKNTFYYDNFAEGLSESDNKKPMVSTAETIYVDREFTVPRSRYCTTLFCRPPPRG